MKKLLFGLGLGLIGTFAQAQNGLESVIIEKYYVSNAADAAGSVGTLPVGSVTYRIYADLLPGYKFQMAYGDASHSLKLTTTTTFFNNEDRGAKSPTYTSGQGLPNGPPIVISGTNRPLYMFYKIDNTDNIRPSYNANCCVFGSSQWVNANPSLPTGEDQLSMTNYGTLGVLGGLRWGFVRFSGSTFTVFLPPLLVDPAVNPNMYIYCRIGLPMMISCSFESVTMNIS